MSYQNKLRAMVKDYELSKAEQQFRKMRQEYEDTYYEMKNAKSLDKLEQLKQDIMQKIKLSENKHKAQWYKDRHKDTIDWVKGNYKKFKDEIERKQKRKEGVPKDEKKKIDQIIKLSSRDEQRSNSLRLEFDNKKDYDKALNIALNLKVVKISYGQYTEEYAGDKYKAYQITIKVKESELY